MPVKIKEFIVFKVRKKEINLFTIANYKKIRKFLFPINEKYLFCGEIMNGNI